MKIVLLQPPYPSEGSFEAAEGCLQWMDGMVRQLKPEDCDLLLLPEYANCPGLSRPEEMQRFVLDQGSVFIDRMAEESRRLGCLLALGLVFKKGARWLNGTAFFECGEPLTPLPEKGHLTRTESDECGLSPGKGFEIVQAEGLRIGCAPCFDVYFPEVFAGFARADVDLILSPSYQRSESPDRIRLLSCSRALDSGAWFARSSYAMPGGQGGGETLVAGPDGTLLASAGRQPGIIRCEFDPHSPFMKPRSHGKPAIEHRALIQAHRRPGLYDHLLQTQGPDRGTSAPRLCAHRGLSHACPENTLPAFAAALALGVHEIEFDLWLSRDGVPVVCHDPRVDRTTDGQGTVMDLDWSDLCRMDAGIRFGESWRGLAIPRFDEVIELVNHRAIMNIHIKDSGPDGGLVRMVCDRIRQEGLVDRAYIAGHSPDVLAEALRYDPDIERACLIGQSDPETQQTHAEKYRCRRIQFPRTVTAGQCRRAHEAGMVCNLFFADTVEDARDFVDRGIDVVLTNRSNILFEAGIFERNRSLGQ